MKKSLLALAVLSAFAGIASAQSSVTISGIVDEGVSKGNGGTAVNNGANGLSKAYQVRDGGPGSRLVIRGNEDMGGGLSAQFFLDHRFAPDTGNLGSSTTPSTVFWSGNSWVQLTSAQAGSVYLGRNYAPAFWVNLKTDPFGYGGIAQVGAKGWAGYTGPGGVRYANTVGYKTPNLGGFTANAAVAAGEAATNREQGINAEYTAGPIYVGIAYDKLSGNIASSAAAPSGDGASLINVGAAYDFKFIRPIVYFARSKTGLGNSSTNKYAHVAVTAPVGPGVVKALYSRLSPEGTVTGVQTAYQKQTKIGAGYDYFFSKRTRVYTEFSQGKEVNRTNNNAWALGVRHEF
jgi:predicted porin